MNPLLCCCNPVLGRTPELDTFAAVFAVAGEKQEMVADQETAISLKRFSANPDVEKAKAGFERAQESIEEELNCFNEWHHVSEEIFRLPTIIIPMWLLIGITVPQVLIRIWIIQIVGKMIHVNSRISYGPLKYLIAEPRYHRIHHSVERKHWDKNFASFFPIWDIIFGTAYFPKKEEYPATGLSDQPEPRTVVEVLARNHFAGSRASVP